MAELTDAKRRIIEALKRSESTTAHELAARVGTTPTAVRQHLDTLVAAGLVERIERDPSPAPGRGRPAARWRPTALAAELFPDRHGDLTVELIQSVREALGDEALAAVVDRRAAGQAAAYSALMPRDATLDTRVRVLADRRSAEGYLAEVITDANPGVVLIEHHCPICTAATACQNLCRSELDVFRAALGPDVSVEREQHLLSGDARCAYRIRAN